MLACPRPPHTPAPPLQVQTACMLGNLISRHKHCVLGTQAGNAVGTFVGTCMLWGLSGRRQCPTEKLCPDRSTGSGARSRAGLSL